MHAHEPLLDASAISQYEAENHIACERFRALQDLQDDHVILPTVVTQHENPSGLDRLPHSFFIELRKSAEERFFFDTIVEIERTLSDRLHLISG